MLNPRQRNQIKAALTFWNAVAETSRVHPMEHPKVRSFFEGELTPLIVGEIDDLITLFNLECDQEQKIVTIAYMVHSLQQYGLSRARLKMQAERDNVESVTIHGSPIKLYNPTDLVPCARKIAERDAQTERKYHVEQKTSPPISIEKSIKAGPPPTDSDKSG